MTYVALAKGNYGVMESMQGDEDEELRVWAFDCPKDWDTSKTWHYISHICDLIRAGEAEEHHWAFLKTYASPILHREMVKYVCRRNAGIVK